MQRHGNKKVKKGNDTKQPQKKSTRKRKQVPTDDDTVVEPISSRTRRRVTPTSSDKLQSNANGRINDSSKPKEDDNNTIVHKAKYSIGIKVAKEFYDDECGKERYFWGFVSAYDSDEKLYQVKYYEDGDEEELTEEELEKIVCARFKDNGLPQTTTNKWKCDFCPRIFGTYDEALDHEKGCRCRSRNSPADDIDTREADNPVCVTNYVQDMYMNYRLKEVSTSVRPVYMETQDEITKSMRSELVDELIDVHLRFRLLPETLYLTVNILDRYLLAETNVEKDELRLVGFTALIIASKYEERYPPDFYDLVDILDADHHDEYVKSKVSGILMSLCPFKCQIFYDA